MSGQVAAPASNKMQATPAGGCSGVAHRGSSRLHDDLLVGGDNGDWFRW